MLKVDKTANAEQQINTFAEFSRYIRNMEKICREIDCNVMLYEHIAQKYGHYDDIFLRENYVT